MRTLSMLFAIAALAACTNESSKLSSASEAKDLKATSSANKVGAPIDASAPVVALATVVKDPSSLKGKQFVTTGTVTAVCQEMGCWMEIKDDATEAHIKMAGEKFFVPKTSAGHKARVQGTLVDGAGGDAECNHEAEEQMGKQVAKLQLEATGVELVD